MSDGFRCYECGKVYNSMWGDTCNKCRAEERRHQEVLASMAKKTKCVTRDWGRYRNGISRFIRGIWTTVGS